MILPPMPVNLHRYLILGVVAATVLYVLFLNLEIKEREIDVLLTKNELVEVRAQIERQNDRVNLLKQQSEQRLAESRTVLLEVRKNNQKVAQGIDDLRRRVIKGCDEADALINEELGL